MTKKKSGTYFDEEIYSPEETTTTTTTTKESNVMSNENVELNFKSVDTGDFDIPRMTEKQDTFIGKFIRFWKEDEGDIFNGIEFRSYPENRRSILPDNYKLVKFFSILQDAEGKSYDKENTVFKIVRTGTKELDKGSIALFDILASRIG